MNNEGRSLRDCLDKLLIQNNMTRNDLADKSGLSLSSINNIFIAATNCYNIDEYSLEKSRITRNSLEKISMGLNISISDFFEINSYEISNEECKDYQKIFKYFLVNERYINAKEDNFSDKFYLKIQNDVQPRVYHKDYFSQLNIKAKDLFFIDSQWQLLPDIIPGDTLLILRNNSGEYDNLSRINNVFMVEYKNGYIEPCRITYDSVNKSFFMITDFGQIRSTDFVSRYHKIISVERKILKPYDFSQYK